MAERFLPDAVMQAMSEHFDEAITATVNNEYADKYLKMADEMSRIYLK